MARLVTKPDRKKIGLSLSKESQEMMDALVEASGRTKSNIVEEALKIMHEHEKTIAARAKRIAELGDEALMDFEEYVKNRREKSKADLYNDTNKKLAV
jgi:predicted DNA-binding protein